MPWTQSVVISAAPDQGSIKETIMINGGRDVIMKAGNGRFYHRFGAWLLSLAVGGGIIVAFILLIGDIEQGMTDLATLLPIGYAFGAGMVASVNPCGFVMLPAFVGYYIGTEAPTGPVRRGSLSNLIRGGGLVTAVTAGFIILFSGTGIIISLGGRLISEFFPIAGLLLGIGLAGLGVWLLLTGKEFGVAAASRIRIPARNDFRSLFLFGMAYGIASLACTLPVFLAVIGSVLVSQGLLQGLAVFISYALGMGTVLAAVVIGAALFRNAVGGFLKRLLPYVHRVSAALLVGAGVYLIYYWWSYGII